MMDLIDKIEIFIRKNYHAALAQANREEEPLHINWELFDKYDSALAMELLHNPKDMFAAFFKCNNERLT
ncbi:MAG: hypothetical protein WC613_05875, partial [Candidatus Aenigmatarchaeota archaeon]